MRTLFPVIFAGQSIFAVTNMLLMTAPAIVVDVWFPLSEAASAYAICSGAFTVGTLLSNLIPPLLVTGPNLKNRNSTDWSDGIKQCNSTMYNNFPTCDAMYEVRNQMLMLFGGQCVVAVTCLLLVVFGFPASPKYPPSLARRNAKELRKLKTTGDSNMYFLAIGNLLKTVQWVLIAMAGGIIHGVNMAIVVFLNQMVKPTLQTGTESVT